MAARSRRDQAPPWRGRSARRRRLGQAPSRAGTPHGARAHRRAARRGHLPGSRQARRARASYDATARSRASTPAPYVMGLGKLDGRPVAIGGEDFTIRGGTSWGSDRRKGGQGGFVEDLAFHYRIPLVNLIDGAGGTRRLREAARLLGVSRHSRLRALGGAARHRAGRERGHGDRSRRTGGARDPLALVDHGERHEPDFRGRAAGRRALARRESGPRKRSAARTSRSMSPARSTTSRPTSARASTRSAGSSPTCRRTCGSCRLRVAADEAADRREEALLAIVPRERRAALQHEEARRARRRSRFDVRDPADVRQLGHHVSRAHAGTRRRRRREQSDGARRRDGRESGAQADALHRSLRHVPHSADLLRRRARLHGGRRGRSGGDAARRHAHGVCGSAGDGAGDDGRHPQVLRHGGRWERPTRTGSISRSRGLRPNGDRCRSKAASRRPIAGRSRAPRIRAARRPRSKRSCVATPRRSCTAEAFAVEDVIDPRDTRPYLCRFLEAASGKLATTLGPKYKCGVRP